MANKVVTFGEIMIRLGLIFGLLHYENDQQALEFATAASCLKL